MRITNVEHTTYRPLFANSDIAMAVATVEENANTLMFTQLEGEDYWACDSWIKPNGMVVFSHGAGDRTCSKRIAIGELAAMLDNAKEN